MNELDSVHMHYVGNFELFFLSSVYVHFIRIH